MNQLSPEARHTEYARRHNGCPACGAGLKRVHRSLGERIISIVSPRFRYRCRSFFCRWEGCLPRQR